jgi:hypothetical protein
MKMVQGFFCPQHPSITRTTHWHLLKVQYLSFSSPLNLKWNLEEIEWERFSPNYSTAMVLTVRSASLFDAPLYASTTPIKHGNSDEHIPNRNHLTIQRLRGAQLPAFPNQERRSNSDLLLPPIPQPDLRLAGEQEVRWQGEIVLESDLGSLVGLERI